MAINRFNKLTRNTPISQFIPRDTRLMAKVLAEKQGQYDRTQLQQQVFQDEFSNLSAVGQADAEILKVRGQAMNDIAQEYSKRDLGDRTVNKEITSKMSAIKNDPLVKATQQTAKAVSEHQAAKQTMMANGTYRRENDPMALQLQAYEANGGAVGGPLNFSGIAKGVDEREAAEKLFNNLPKTGQYKFAQLGDTVKKVGWEGVTSAQIENVLGSSIEIYANSQAGKQAQRRYFIERSEGTLPVDATGEPISLGGYIGKIITGVSAEFGGVVSTSAQLTGGGGSAGGGNNTGITTQITKPSAKRLSGIEFTDDGAIKGSGNSSYIDALMGDDTFSDVYNDESLTDDEQSQYRDVIDLAAAQGISHQAAAERLDTRSEVQFRPLTGTEQRNKTESFFKKGAGIYDTMTAIDENGNEILPQKIFEDADLLDSNGNFDPDVAKTKGISVDGEVGPNSGIAPAGIVVSIGTEDFIFVNRNPSLEQVKAYIQATLDSQDIAEIPDYVRGFPGYEAGKRYVRDKDGKTQILN